MVNATLSVSECEFLPYGPRPARGSASGCAPAAPSRTWRTQPSRRWSPRSPPPTGWSAARAAAARAPSAPKSATAPRASAGTCV
eukprot:4368465-Pyramimonas_sp.AAC.1